MEKYQVVINTNLMTDLEETQVSNRCTIKELEDAAENWDRDNKN